MEQKESNFKTILSVVFSCTRNVGLGVLALYLVYFLGSVISNNWNNIWPNIVDFSQLFVPIIDFVAAHMLLFLAANVILFFWILCIIVKLEDRKIEISVLVYSLLFILIFLFGILLMISAFKLLTGIFAGMTGLVGFIILAFFSCALIMCIFDDESTTKKTTSSTDRSPKQLDLFDDQK